mmetsp:Transcript_28062/g.64953  ORF Transcript_28062/g.64953 Transcript_28062/m.64953 type:complete len:98 (-) Transcript_28062:59-352(-)
MQRHTTNCKACQMQTQTPNCKINPKTRLRARVCAGKENVDRKEIISQNGTNVQNHMANWTTKEVSRANKHQKGYDVGSDDLSLQKSSVACTNGHTDE